MSTEDKRKATKRILPVKLTQEELVERGAHLAKQEQAKAALEDEKKEMSSKYNTDIGKAQAEITRLSKIVTEEQEEREVACTETSLFTANLVRITRDDTGETVEERPMGAAERELEMFDENAPPEVAN